MRTEEQIKVLQHITGNSGDFPLHWRRGRLEGTKRGSDRKAASSLRFVRSATRLLDDDDEALAFQPRVQDVIDEFIHDAGEPLRIIRRVFDKRFNWRN